MMEIILYSVVLIFCFYILAKVVDELFIVSLDKLAKGLGMPSNVAGATLMAMGTSAPELATALFALFLVGVSPATGLGTVVGSAIFQVLVVIGFAAMIKTSYLDWKPVVRDTLFYLVSVLMLILILADGQVTLADALLLCSGYLVYLAVLLLWGRFFPESKDYEDPIELVERDSIATRIKLLDNVLTLKEIITWPVEKLFTRLAKLNTGSIGTVVAFILSILAIAGLSYVMLISAEAVATALNISPAIIALTILAGGTSVPELISSAVVSRQGRGDMAISNAIGSNIFDIQISLGLPILLYILINQKSLEVEDSSALSSSVILLFATVVMIISLLISQRFKIGKKFGLLLIAIYVVYVVVAYMELL